MVILFLVALVLAWPTAGLSVVAYIIVVIVRAVLRGKTRMHNANETAALRAIATDTGRLPSWIHDRSKVEEFVYVVQGFAIKRGVPQTFVTKALNYEDNYTTMMHYAGAMEQQGASFTEQKMAYSEVLIKYWNSEQNPR